MLVSPFNGYGGMLNNENTNWFFFPSQLTVTTRIGPTGPLAPLLVAREPQHGLAPVPTRLRSTVVETALI